MFVLCVLHDIGAYKTEEIDRMLDFELRTPKSHAIYGYLFLKYMSDLGDSAEAILHHHTDFNMPVLQRTRYAEYAQLIHLADRVDILTQAQPQADWHTLQRFAGTQFGPALVDALLRAQEKHDIRADLCSGDYATKQDRYIQTMAINAPNVISYLKMLVYAIDFRSEVTVTHTATTTAITMELARLLELPREIWPALELGAFLHDVGKIAIPVEILKKPDRLTDAEMDIMRRHVVYSGEIIEGMVSEEIQQIAIRHHEKINGSGYPCGLCASELTQPQRIVAVADVMSALGGKRSYKDSFPREKILSILTEMRNSGQLCPIVSGVAINHYDEIMANTAVKNAPILQMYEKMHAEYKRLA